MHERLRLETDRLVLRPLQHQDAPALYAYFSDPEVMRYFGMEPFTCPTQAEDFLESLAALIQEGRAVRWAMTRKSDGRLVGTIGFHGWHQRYFRADIGYDLAPEHWGLGLATEAAARVVTYGFEEMVLNRIQAVVVPANPASRRVLAKIGFRGEGILREYLVSDERFMDVEMLRLLRSEYAGRLDDAAIRNCVSPGPTASGNTRPKHPPRPPAMAGHRPER